MLWIVKIEIIGFYGHLIDTTQMIYLTLVNAGKNKKETNV